MSLGPARRDQRGVTLVEIMVVMLLLALVMAVAIPGVSALLALEQSAAAKELGLTFKHLRDEAALRNVTFRIRFDLDARTYSVEVGDPDTLIFSDPDERAEWEEDRLDQLARFTQRELEEGAAAELEGEVGRFDKLTDPVFRTEVELPSGSAFAWVWTPQYEDPVEPHDEPPEDPLENAVAYSFVFPNGFVEHTVIRIVSVDDPEEGYSIEVEPVSGRVTVTDELLSHEDSMSWIPEEAPELPL